VRSWRPDTRLVAAVFSHHHVDHVFGVRAFDDEAAQRSWPRPLVYGHAGLRPNFDRYKKTRGWNGAINLRQFAIPVERFDWPAEYRYVDVEYEERMTIRVGAYTFELRHGRGETDDATWTWIPERKILAPGDLFIWASPNAGNPQKTQRYCGEWAAALREMAALGAEAMIPGHGMPIFGGDRVAQALGDTAELLESLEAQVLTMMNTGCSLDSVLHDVKMPEQLLSKPYLRPVYDHPQFILRNIWRLYGGWYDGEPDNLLPAPRAEQAREWVSLAGGVDNVLSRVEKLRDAGNLRLACHIVEYAALAEPSSERVHALRKEIYAAPLASEKGKRDLAGNF
jgi:alkyl sulfatase BDS1-like metallo-beta-lactamase superfamily hydrolase